VTDLLLSFNHPMTTGAIIAESHDICFRPKTTPSGRLLEKMSRATPDDQLKFLLSCVKHSNNGKVSHRLDISANNFDADSRQIDFVEVAQECGVVSKGAALVVFLKLILSRADASVAGLRGMNVS
jgi:hypothetical protein